MIIVRRLVAKLQQQKIIWQGCAKKDGNKIMYSTWVQFFIVADEDR